MLDYQSLCARDETKYNRLCGGVVAHMLGVTVVVWEEGGDVEHNLPVLVHSVHRLLASLIVVHV